MQRDNYGRLWPDNIEVCPECGQPDNCGDCNHEKISGEDAIALGALAVGSEVVEILALGSKEDVLAWIEKARRAQQENEQKHDVQLEIPKPRPKLPLFDSGNPELGKEASEMFGGPDEKGNCS